MNKFLGFSIIFASSFLGGCATPELAAIGFHMLKSLVLAIPFTVAVIGIIFLMNKWIVHPDGRTNERICSIVGLGIFPLLIAAFFGLIIGFDWIVVIPCIIAGGIIGWYSYTLDEMMESFWENRRKTVPGALGVLLGGWIIILMFTNVWKQGDMYVVKTACAKRQVIERYTYHSQTDKDGKDTSYYSWDDHHSGERVVAGDAFPDIREGVDYVLGIGDAGRKDRLGRVEYYRFIGGNFFSEKKGSWNSFRWLLLSNANLRFQTGVVQNVKSNFFGHPIKNGGLVSSYSDLPNISANNIPIPSISDLPPMETIIKALSTGVQVIALLFSDDEYKEILYFFLGIVGLLALVAIFFPVYRESICIFAICFSVIPLLIMLVAASRGGRLSSFSSGESYRGRGGDYGGGGSSGNW